MNKYIVIGGYYHRTYTGTGVCTSLHIIGKGNNQEDIKRIVSENFDDCGGLMFVLDTETGERAEI